jgi:hypothetical protein
MPSLLTPGGGGSPIVTPSVEVTVPGGYPGPLVLNTLGDLDWIVGINPAGNPVTVATQNRKRGAGWIHNTFTWIPAGRSQFNASGGATCTATAADNQTGVAYSGNPINGYQNLGGGFGMGFTFRVPATTTTRYVRLYQGWGGGNLKITGTLTDGTTHNVISGAGGGEVRIAYKASSHGQELTVSTEMVTGAGTVTHWVQAIILASTV